MPKTRPAYPAEFRRQMVDLVRAGRDPTELAREFEPSRQTIQNWVAEADRGAGGREAEPPTADPGLTTTERDEFVRLRRESFPPEPRNPASPLRPSTALLVLACSVAKRPDPSRIPAIARYNGPLWRTLCATDPVGRSARVAFHSARFGFRDAATPIADYNAQLTADFAARMIAGGVTTRWLKPPLPRWPDMIGVHAGAEIAGLTRNGDEPFEKVALTGRRLYLDVMHALLAGFVGMGPNARVNVINGPIGLTQWDPRIRLYGAAQTRGGRS